MELLKNTKGEDLGQRPNAGCKTESYTILREAAHENAHKDYRQLSLSR
jgi:hypothetical protein